MKNSIVRVFLEDGKEVVFSTERQSPVEIKNWILNMTNGPWHYYENAQGEGFFKKDSVVRINIEN